MALSRPISWSGVSKIDKKGRRFSKLTREHFRREIILVRQVQIAVSGTMPHRVVAEHVPESRKNDSTQPSPNSLSLRR
jgi:hypothetical protein